MSSFDRRRLLLCAAAFTVAGGLAGCGFTPVYGPGGAGRALYGRIVFEAPPTEAGYLIIRELEERLGRATQADFHLLVEPVLEEDGQAITASGEITRISLLGQTEFALRRVGSDDILTSGDVQSFTGYSATGSTVETLAAESDARERLMTILADQIATRLLSTPGLAP